MSRTIRALSKTLLVGALMLPMSSCNMFDPIDNPTSDAQLISAGRACMDKGDYTCAAEMYGKVSSEQADVAASEAAFNVMAQNGITMGDFMSAIFGNTDNIPGAFTTLANLIAGSGANETVRLQIFAAYQKGLSISTSSKQLRGLVRFVTASILFAELLAEDGTGGKFVGSDLVKTPNTCKTLNFDDPQGLASACVTGDSCKRPAGKTIVVGSNIGSASGTVVTDLTTATTAQMSGTPTFKMIHAALTEMVAGLGDALGSSDGVGADITSFASAILSEASITLDVNDPTSDEGCLYRFLLVSQGFGI